MAKETSKKPQAATKSVAKPATKKAESTPKPATVVTDEMLTTSKKNNKLMMIAAAVAVVVIAVVLYFAFGTGVSKKDYENAYTAIKEVRDNYSAAGSTVSSASIGLSGRELDVEEIRSKFDAYKGSVESLKDLKALRDKDIKEKYDAFVKKNEEFQTYTDNFINSIDGLNAVTEKCSAMSSLSSSSFSDVDSVLEKYDEKAKPCLEAVNALKDSKIESLSKMAGEVASSMEEMRDILGKMVTAAKASDRTAVITLNSSLSRKTIEMRTAASKFSTTIRNEVNDKDVKDELNDLGKTITSKLNESK